VTAEFSARAGVEVYGFPKWVCDIQVKSTSHEAACTFVSEGQDVFSLSARVPSGSSHGFTATSVHAYSFRDGSLRRCRFTVEGESVNMRPLGAQLELGTHRMSAELRALGLSRRALCVARIERMRAEFGPPEIVR
jgi:hypothetical protein